VEFSGGELAVTGEVKERERWGSCARESDWQIDSTTG
jgi:hypothetical protein